MVFVKNDELKVGMRLAKPIYNKKGVLLYDRNSRLTEQGIESVRNFGLIGLYILEPAEPLPPMSPDDIEFERFQTIMSFQIQDELAFICKNNRANKASVITLEIIKHYGRLQRKINFVQNLRSNDDYVYKHSLNCAILCAMMSHVLNIKIDEQGDCVTAAYLHDIGKLSVPKEIQEKGMNLDDYERSVVDKFEREGAGIIESAFTAQPALRRIVAQTYKHLSDIKGGRLTEQSLNKMVMGARILAVAETFDTMTAMNDFREPSSEITALRYLQSNPYAYDQGVVRALVRSIYFLANGCCIELNNGQKGLVINANDDDVLRPIVLQFSNNNMIDLARNSMGLEIKDVMKTMDNRFVMK